MLTSNLNSISRMNYLIILIPRYSRNWITFDMASDINITTLWELILSYRYIGCDRHCEIINIINKISANEIKGKKKKKKRKICKLIHNKIINEYKLTVFLTF